MQPGTDGIGRERAEDRGRVLIVDDSRLARAVVALHLDGELAPSEIAVVLGVTPNAARVALHRGLTTLRAALTEPSPGAP